MRRATKSRGVNRKNGNGANGANGAEVSTDTDDNFNTGDNKVTSTATATLDETDEAPVRELPFEVQITPAPADYRPDRSPAGRKRIPSPFEPLLPDLKGKGWQNQPHDGKVEAENRAEIIAAEETGGSVPTAKYNTTTSVKDSNARVILRELAKAVKWLNTEEGGELNLGLDVNVTATDVQFNIRDKQKRKAQTPEGAESSDFDSDDEDDEDNGDE